MFKKAKTKMIIKLKMMKIMMIMMNKTIEIVFMMEALQTRRIMMN